jgi:hypothetical protein
MGQIRLFRPEDMEQLLDLQEKIAKDLDIKFKRSTARNTITTMYESEKSIMIVAEEGFKLVGSIGALVLPSTTNEDVLIAKELGWYVLPEYRKGVGMQLFKALERLLTQLHCEYYVSVPKGSPALARIFKGLGYSEAETIYKKEL